MVVYLFCMPFNSPFAALLIASFIVSAVASFLVTRVKSIRETFGVGTLIAVPSSLPFKLGNTKPLLLQRPLMWVSLHLL